MGFFGKLASPDTGAYGCRMKEFKLKIKRNNWRSSEDVDFDLLIFQLKDFHGIFHCKFLYNAQACLFYKLVHLFPILSN